MNDQTIQQIEDLLLQGTGHQDIINKIAAAQGDDPAIAKQTAEYLKKKEQAQPSVGTESSSAQSSSESAGDDFFTDEKGQKILASLPEAEVGVEADKKEEPSEEPVAATTEFYGKQEGQSDRKLDKAEEYPEYDKKLYEFYNRLQKAETTDQVRQVFKDAGKEEYFEEYIELLRANDPYRLKMYEAEEEYRSRFGAPLEGSFNIYDLPEVVEQVGKKKAELQLQIDNVKQDIRSFRVKNNMSEIMGYHDPSKNPQELLTLESKKKALESDRKDLNQKIIEGTDAFNDAVIRKREKDQFLAGLSPEAYEIFESYNQEYSRHLLKSLTDLLKEGNMGELDPSQIAYYEMQLMRGEISLREVLLDAYNIANSGEGVYDAVGQESENVKRIDAGREIGVREGDLNVVLNMMVSEMQDAAQKSASDIAKKRFDSYEKINANAIEREFRGVLSVDFNNDQFIAPTGFFESRLSNLRIGPFGASLGTMVRGVFSDEEVDEIWDNVSTVYEPMQKATDSIEFLLEDIVSGLGKIGQGMQNIFAVNGEYTWADEFAEKLNDHQKEIEATYGEAIPNEDGTLNFRGMTNEASKSFGYSAFTLGAAFVSGGSSYVIYPLLAAGVGNDLHMRVKDEEWYKNMSPFERMSYIGLHTGAELGWEILGNRFLLAKGPFSKKVGQGLLQTGAKAVGNTGARLGGEASTELITLYSGNIVDNMMLTPYGVSPKPIFDAAETYNTAGIALLMSGTMSTPVQGYRYVSERTEINRLKGSISENLGNLRSQSLTQEEAETLAKKIVSDQKMLVGMMVNEAEYGQWLSENKPDEYALLSEYSQDVKRIIAELRKSGNSPATIQALKGQLATALQLEYETSFIGYHDYIKEIANTAPAEKLDSIIGDLQGQLKNEKSREAELRVRYENGEDVRGEMNLASDKIARIKESIDTLANAREAVKKEETSAAESEAIVKGVVEMNRQEQLDFLKKAADIEGVTIPDGVLIGASGIVVENGKVHAVNAQGRTIFSFEHGKADLNDTRSPAVAMVPEDEKGKMEGMGYVEVNASEGMSYMVYDPKGMLGKFFPNTQFSEDPDLALNKAAQLGMLMNAFSHEGTGKTAVKASILAEAMSKGLSAEDLGSELADFYNKNRDIVEENLQLIEDVKESRSANDLKDAGEPTTEGKVANEKANKLVEIARKMGLNVVVGSEASVFLASNRRLPNETEEQYKKRVEETWLNGFRQFGSYEKGLIRLSETARVKDVIEEILHATILRDISSSDERAERFKNDLEAMISKDPWMGVLLDAKESEYRARMEQAGEPEHIIDRKIKEERLAEAMSLYVSEKANLSDSLKSSIRQRITQAYKSFMGVDISSDIDVTNDNIDLIIEKISNSLSQGRLFKSVQNEDQSREEQANVTDEKLDSAYRGSNSFLHNKEVTITIRNHGGRETRTKVLNKTFKDYRDFRNYWAWASGNQPFDSRFDVEISYMDGDKKKFLNPPKALPWKEPATPGLFSLQTPQQAALKKQADARKRAEDRYAEMEDLKQMLLNAGVEKMKALEILGGWNGYGIGSQYADFLTDKVLQENRQAAGDYLAEMEMTSPASEVMFSGYYDIMNVFDEVFDPNQFGVASFDRRKFNSDEEYRQAVLGAFEQIAGDDKAMQNLIAAATDPRRRLTAADVQQFMMAIGDKVFSDPKKKRSGFGAKAQQIVVDKMVLNLRHLMNTEDGKKFVNFFSDFRDSVPDLMKIASEQHGVDYDTLMEDKDLFLGFVAVLSNGNEAQVNIDNAIHLYAEWASGDENRFKLALNQMGNIGYYPGIGGRPESARTDAHIYGINRMVEYYNNRGEKSFYEVLTAPYPGDDRRRKPRKHSEKENLCFISQDGGKNGAGLSRKIGHFAAALQRQEGEEFLAQDSHFHTEMLRYRGVPQGISSAKVKEVRDIMSTNKEGLEATIKELNKGRRPGDQLRMPTKTGSNKENAIRIEQICRALYNKQSGWTARGKDAKFFMKPYEMELVKWYTNNVKNRLESKPKNNDVRNLHYTITKKVADELGISVAAVQQLMFYENHLIQQSFGFGKGAEAITFADAASRVENTDFRNAMPSENSPEFIKAQDAFLRSMISEGEVSLQPSPKETFELRDIEDDLDYVVGNAWEYSNKPLKGSYSSFNIDYSKGRGGYTITGSGSTRVNALVLSDVVFPEGSKSRKIEGNVEDYADNREDILNLQVSQGREITFKNGRWYSGGSPVSGAGSVVMVGSQVFATDVLFAEDSDFFASEQAEHTEEQIERGYDDPVFMAALDVALVENPGLSREEAEVIAAEVYQEPVFSSSQMRGTAARVTDSPNFDGNLRQMVAENPENYFKPSSLNDAKAAMDHMTTAQLMAYMRDDKLGELKTDENYGPLAAITLINRYHESGDNESAAALISELSATGTNVGRLLRQFAELNTSSPESLSMTVIAMAERNGKKVDEKTKKYVDDQSRIVFEMHKKAKELFVRGQQGEDVWEEYQKALKDLSVAEKDLDIIANTIVERTWGELIRTTIQGNLLTPMSQATNVVANLSNFIPKTMVDVTAYPMERMLEKAFPDYYKKKKGLDRKLTGSSYLYGLQAFGKGWIEALDDIRTGQSGGDLTEWRISRSMMPLHSLMAFAGSNIPESKTKAQEYNQRAKLLFQGTFGMPAEGMFRLLGLGDTPFRRYAEKLELAQIADARGLTGDEKTQFMRFPPDDVINQAKQKGLEFTFQSSTSASEVAEATLGSLARGFGKPFNRIEGFDGEDFFNTIIRMNVPYVRTPANLLEETLTYASPAIAMARCTKHLLEGDPRKASENFAKGMVGQTVMMTGMYLVANGLVSGPPDDDKAVRSLQYDAFPPNNINISGLKRLMSGGDPSPQEGDEFRNYQKLGLFGGILGAVASSTSIEAAKEISDNPFGPTEIFKRTFGFDNVATLSYMMDQSFLQGLNSSLSVLSVSNPDEAERAWTQWVEGMFRSFSAVPLPNTLSAINRTQREYMPDMRSSSLSERLENTLRDRTFATSSLPIRHNWKGEPIKQTPDGSSSIGYQLFDVTKGREGSSDPVSIEALRIYQETGEAIKVLDIPYFAQSVYRHLKPPSLTRGKPKKAYEKGKKYQFIEDGVNFKMKLNAEQVNEALRLAAQLRYAEVEKFVGSEEYKGLTDQERISRFETINGKYNGLVEVAPDGTFMPHTVYILDQFEKNYLERLADGEEFETN